MWINIDSRNRTAGDNSRYTYHLLAPKKVSSFQVRSVAIPRCFYNVTATNNRIDFDEGGVELNGTIAVGLYDATSILAAVKTGMDAVSGTTYTITVSAVTGMMTFVPAVGVCSLHWSSGANTLINASEILGFRSSGAVQAPDVAAAGTITSPLPIELNPEKYIFLKFSVASSSGMLSQRDSSEVMAIPVNVGAYEDIFYEINEAVVFHSSSDGREVSDFEIQLCYANHAAVDLRGRSFGINMVWN